MRRPLRVALGLVLVAAGFEVASRVALSAERFSRPHDRAADATWRQAWVDRHRDVEVYYPFDVYHPTRGWALARDLEGVDAYGPNSLSSNSIGLRGRREFAIEPADDRKRIVLLGDSFTFGEEVVDDEVYSERLQALLPDAEVLNFGVHGYGHDQMLLYFVEEAFRYQPDVVVLGFVRDDMVRNVRGFRDYAKPRMLLREDGIEVTAVPVPTPRQTLLAHRLGPRLLDLADVLGEGILWRTGRRERQAVEITAALLDRIAAEAAEGGAVTVFAYLPHSEELIEQTPALPEEQFFETYCDGRAAFCVNLRPLFLDRIAAGESVKMPGHWHGTGHRLVAEGLARYLRARDLV